MNTRAAQKSRKRGYGVRFFLFFLTACTAFSCLVACRTEGRHYFAYADKEFDAELSGIFLASGMAFRARLSVEKKRGAGVAQRRLCLQYSDPPLLCGMTLEAVLWESGEIGEITVLLENTAVRQDQKTLEGLLLPATLLLKQESPSQIQKKGEGYLLTFLARSVVLDARGFPAYAQNGSMELSVTRWEEKRS
ncbi:MAG: hypothetical protein IKC31_03840 [Clostridia bacterium]|nr:hypothetical protein [Clostridia bacterium]